VENRHLPGGSFFKAENITDESQRRSDGERGTV